MVLCLETFLILIFLNHRFRALAYNNSNNFLASIGLIFGSSALIFFAYYGFENIPNIAEETRNPSKTISRAILLSIIITTIVISHSAFCHNKYGADDASIVIKDNVWNVKR